MCVAGLSIRPTYIQVNLRLIERQVFCSKDSKKFQAGISNAASGSGRLAFIGAFGFNQRYVLRPDLPMSEDFESFRVPYQQRLAQLQASPYLHFPQAIQLETQALCPAACSFCTYPQLQRKGTRMDDALIDKILTDLEDIPPQLPFQLMLYKVSDPFMDPRLQPLLKRVNRRLPNARLTLHTSAAPLTEAKLLALDELTQFHYLGISIHDPRPEVYQQLMQLPWERTLDRLMMIHAHKAAGRVRFPVILARVGDGSPDDRAFEAWAQQAFPLFHPLVSQRGTWIGQVPGMEPTQAVPPVGCLHWYELAITATGQVALCCMDGQAEWPLGDVRRQHVLEVYNSPAYRRLRVESRLRTELAPCQGCTFF